MAKSNESTGRAIDPMTPIQTSNANVSEIARKIKLFEDFISKSRWRGASKILKASTFTIDALLKMMEGADSQSKVRFYSVMDNGVHGLVAVLIDENGKIKVDLSTPNCCSCPPMKLDEIIDP